MTATPVRRDVNARRGGRLVPFLALLASVATVPSLLAWILQSPTLAQPLPTFPVARPPTVGMLILSTVGLVSTWAGYRRAAAWMSIAVTVGGVIGAIIGASSTDPTVGMSVVVGGMFVMFGVALWLLATPPVAQQSLVWSGAIGATILALSGVLLVVTLGGMVQTEIGRRIAQVSLTTLVGLMALSIGLMRFVAAHEAAGVAPPRWLPVVVGSSGALTMILFWQVLVAREAQELSARASIESDAVQRAIRRQFLAVDRGIARVGLYATDAPADAPLWRTSVARLSAETPGLERILWLDSAGVLLRATDTLPTSPELLEQFRRWEPALLQRALRRGQQESHDEIPIESRAIGPTGIALLLPVAKTAHGPALLVALVSTPELMRDFMNDHTNGYAVRAFVGDSLLAGPATTSAEPVFRSALDFGDRRVDFTFTPDGSAIRTAFPESLLLLGLALAALIAVTLWLARRSWEEASVEGMARMQRAIERPTDGVWELDLLRGGAHRSGTLLTSLGYETQKMNGLASTWNALVHPDDRSRVADTLAAHVRGDTDAFEAEYRVRAADQTWHTIVDRGRVIERTSDGQPTRLLGISADITERTRAEAEQQRSDRRFRAMFDSVYQLQLLLDLDGTILEANRAAADFAGVSVDAIQGTAFRDLRWWNGDEMTIARVQERVDRARTGDATRFEIPATSAQGRAATIDFSLRPVRDGSERVSQILVEGHDFTERKRAEESLREMGALTTMGQLAARVAHEINNPLAGIQNAFLLVSGGISPDHPHYKFVGAIEREIGRIAAVTRQLYETYRPDQAMDSQSSVILAISDAVSFLEQVNRARHVKIRTNVTRAPSLVPVPDALLRQTLYNLVQNAVDASPANGTIEVSAVHEGNECVIRVADEGSGIPAEIRQHIFEPFFSTKDRTIKTGGMGIGLSLVRQSVLAVGGQVLVRDRPEGGTEFEVRLPMQPIDTGVLR